MKKTSIAFLIASLFAISACSPSDEAKPTTSNTSAPAAPAQATATQTNNVTTSETLGSDVIATVNGQPISNAQIQTLIEMTQKANPGAPVDEEMIKDNVITQEILVQEARRLGLDKSDDYKIQAEFMTKALLTSMLYNDFVKNNPVSDEEINKEYDFIKEQLAQSQEAQTKEFLARHILVDNEEKAKEIIAQLKTGGDFAELAKENSLDSGSAQDGGSLGSWTNVTVFVPEFANALAGMNKGDSSEEPVKTQFGWHIIRVDDTREVDAPAEQMPELNDHIKDQLRGQLMNRKFLEHEEKLIQEADIVKSE